MKNVSQYTAISGVSRLEVESRFFCERLQSIGPKNLVEKERTNNFTGL